MESLFQEPPPPTDKSAAGRISNSLLFPRQHARHRSSITSITQRTFQRTFPNQWSLMQEGVHPSTYQQQLQYQYQNNYNPAQASHALNPYSITSIGGMGGMGGAGGMGISQQASYSAAMLQRAVTAPMQQHPNGMGWDGSSSMAGMGHGGSHHHLHTHSAPSMPGGGRASGSGGPFTLPWRQHPLAMMTYSPVCSAVQDTVFDIVCATFRRHGAQRCREIPLQQRDWRLRDTLQGTFVHNTAGMDVPVLDQNGRLFSLLSPGGQRLRFAQHFVSQVVAAPNGVLAQTLGASSSSSSSSAPTMGGGGGRGGNSGDDGGGGDKSMNSVFGRLQRFEVEQVYRRERERERERERDELTLQLCPAFLLVLFFVYCTEHVFCKRAWVRFQ